MTVVNPKSISGINSITMASGSDDLLTIHSNNTTERVRVNNSGDVIVGSGVTLSPDGDVFATGVCTATSFSGDGSALTGLASTDVIFSDKISLPDSSAGSINVGLGSDLQIYHNGSHSYILDNGTGELRLASNNITRITKGDSETCATFNVDGSVELYHDNTKQCETSANGLAFPAGKGIDFSAQTASSVSGVTVGAELLDHYEEGDWTPTLTSGETCSVYAASYTRIGRQVTAYCFLYNFSDFNGNSNSFNITGLPFSKDTSNGNYYAGGYVGYVHNMNYGHPLLPLVSGTPAIYFHRQDGTTNTWKYQDFHNVGNGSGGMLIIQVVYHTAS